MFSIAQYWIILWCPPKGLLLSNSKDLHNKQSLVLTLLMLEGLNLYSYLPKTATPNVRCTARASGGFLRTAEDKGCICPVASLNPLPPSRISLGYTERIKSPCCLMATLKYKEKKGSNTAAVFFSREITRFCYAVCNCQLVRH